MDAAPRRFFQTAEQVVERRASAANERGKGVVVPGWHNKLAAALLQLTCPSPWCEAADPRRLGQVPPGGLGTRMARTSTW